MKSIAQHYIIGGMYVSTYFFLFLHENIMGTQLKHFGEGFIMSTHNIAFGEISILLCRIMPKV